MHIYALGPCTTCAIVRLLDTRIQNDLAQINKLTVTVNESLPMAADQDGTIPMDLAAGSEMTASVAEMVARGEALPLPSPEKREARELKSHHILK